MDCPTCGWYSITWEAAHSLENERSFQDKKHLLSGVIRNASAPGERLEVTTYTIPDLLDAASPPENPLEAIDDILLYVLDRTTSAEQVVPVRETDYPAVYAHGPDELKYLVRKAVELGYLERPNERGYRLAPAGWKRAAELQERVPDSNQAFVAMWFTEELRPAWEEGFRPALEVTDYDAVRIDLLEHNDRIDDRILGEIRGSGLLVADFTGNRGGVYFEAGFALGLGVDAKLVV